MIPDLSFEHKPVSTIFPHPTSAAEWEAYRLSDEQVQFYSDYGYCPKIPILNPTQVETLRQELNEWFQPDHPGKELWYEYHKNESADPNTVLFHALGAWRIRPGFHDILWNPAFLVPAAQLIGGAVRFWHDQLFCKPARHGGVVAWHQDYSYWTRTVPMAHLTCWIGLDDSDRNNGCLRYIPKSHQWKLLPITGLAGDMDAIKNVLNDAQWEALHHPVDIEMPCGYGSFHHPLLVHGSQENRIDRPRRAVVINVFRDGVTSASNDPLLAGVPPVPAGQPMDGRFFPLLFDPNSLGIRLTYINHEES